METYNVCIIGGGASGLAAAACIDEDIHVCLLEKNKILGRKIMATGGGRCNITNDACASKSITLDFFNTLGLELYCDSEGRYYPYSNQASDVVSILAGAISAKNLNVKKEFHVQTVSFEGGIFVISDGRETISAENLIIATGGKAAPAMGSTGDGYAFARKAGHHIERVYPILTGIECGDFGDIRGIRARGCVRLFRDGTFVAEETGEIQFTEDGISGICVFNLTPHIKTEKGETLKDALERYELIIDLAPDFSREYIEGRKDSFGIISKKLSQRVDIAHIKSWRLPLLGIKGWKNAQCTAGGVSTKEINMEIMESKIVPGLYFAGEIIDYQGPCGGFNLQNAWETGIKAARAINMIYGQVKNEIQNKSDKA